MIKYSYFIIACILLHSCASEPKTQETSGVDTTLAQQHKGLDTTIEYNIEGIALEGALAVAKYKGGKVQKVVLTLYAETGKSPLVYTFVGNKINVNEKRYGYKTDIMSVKPEDIYIKQELNYTIDHNGKLDDSLDASSRECFKALKENVPFQLN